MHYFYVAVHYSQRVTIFDAVDDGTDRVRRLLLGVVFLLHNAVEELSARHVLQHQVDVLLVLKYLVQLHYVRMVDLDMSEIVVPG